MRETVFLIDVYSLLFQVFHAIPPMSSPSGQPTNAVFGFSRDLVTLLRDHRPDWTICAMDSSAPQVRYEIYAEYKAQRDEMPVDLRPQVGMLCEVIDAFRVPRVEYAGWEADDVIATLCREAVDRGAEVRIVTSDKDARQLLGPQVKLFNFRKNSYFDEATLLADWGVRPDQVVDFQSLVGDAVDNVPGVPLVGPKKAAALLQQFETLEGVLANADAAPGAKLKENLKVFADQARLSRRLVELNQHLPLEFPWESARATPPDLPRLTELFRALGFRRLIDDVRTLAPSPAALAPTSTRTVHTGGAEIRLPQPATGRGLFDGLDDGPASASPTITSVTVSAEELVDATTGQVVAAELTMDIAQVRSESDSDAIVGSAPRRPLPPEAANIEDRHWQIVDTEDEFNRFLDELAKQTLICLDLETTGLDPLRCAIVGWAFCWSIGEAYYLPIAGPPGSQVLDADVVVSRLKPLLERDDLTLANQNIKYDLLVLRSVGIQPRHIGLDPMVGDYLLDAGARSHNLELLINKYFQRTAIPISDLIGTGKQQKSMADVPVVDVAEYATEDADLSLRLVHVIERDLQAESLWTLYWDLERELIPVLADMEYTGIRVDVNELREQSDLVSGRLVQLMAEIYLLAGREFNIDSPIQLRKVLFEEQGLPVRKRTKTGPSTDQEVLEELAALHPLPAKLTEHRHLSKLKGTYLEALPELVNPDTGRIHCSFNQVVAATGRLSSSDPNLQNIPIRTEEGQRIRRAFVPGEPGWKLVCADYSQIELRVLAHFSQDPVLLDAFQRGVDIHTAVAAAVYDVPAEHVTKDQRRVAKAVNFGVIYGQSPFGLATTLGIPKEQAAQFIDEYFRRYSGVTSFLEEILDECQRTGYAKTILGRRRRIEGIRSNRSRNRTLAERTAINSVIQGSAADLIKRAMIRVHNQLLAMAHPARLLLQIHDELVFECPVSHVDDLVTLVRREMSQALTLDVPLEVDVSVGNNWLDTHTVPA